jgi:hypothetical protein
VASYCEYGNEISGSIRDSEFLLAETISFPKRTLLTGTSYLQFSVHTQSA